MEPIKIAENIYWVGAVDSSIRDFHGYTTEKGSTYNAFLVIDEKITLIDTVKAEFLSEMISRIEKIVDPKKIDQVVSNHAEFDHAGSLADFMDFIGPEKPVYTSTMGQKALTGQFPGRTLNLQVVKTGSTLSLGRINLEFIETRMIHWPDSMFTFCPEHGILFSQDAFGMHLATSVRFDDEVCRSVWEYQALKYFANILTPYTDPIGKAIESIAASGLLAKVKMICPDHGIIWRTDPGAIVELYRQWVKQAPSRKAVVVFDTMWHSTEHMAHELADALATHDVLVKLMNLKSHHRSEVVTEIYEAGAVLVGSPTINNDMYPSIAEMLCYMRGLRFKNKIAASFGSYGWSGEGAKLVWADLEKMGYTMPVKEVRHQWIPAEKDMGPIKDLAKIIADSLPKEKVAVTCG